MPKRRAKKVVKRATINEFSLVDFPAHEAAGVRLMKRRGESGKPIVQPKEKTMADKEGASTELAKQAAAANADKETAQAELKKRDAEVAELKKQIADLKAPKPEVIAEVEGIGEVTTADDERLQKMAHMHLETQFAKQAKEKAPDVDETIAVTLLKADKSEELEKLQKQQKAMKAAGRSFNGFVKNTDKSGDEDEYGEPSEAETMAFAKKYDISPTDAKLRIGAEKARQRLATFN